MPQHIYLADIVAANIAFGVSSKNINLDIYQHQKLLIYEFVSNDLPEKYQTTIGRGVRLSGGQRQRIGIAELCTINPKF